MKCVANRDCPIWCRLQYFSRTSRSFPTCSKRFRNLLFISCNIFNGHRIYLIRAFSKLLLHFGSRHFHCSGRHPFKALFVPFPCDFCLHFMYIKWKFNNTHMAVTGLYLYTIIVCTVHHNRVNKIYVRHVSLVKRSNSTRTRTKMKIDI